MNANGALLTYINRDKMNVKMKTVAILLAAQVSAAFAAAPDNTPEPTVGVGAFLKALNSGGGKPIEQLSPAAARAAAACKRLGKSNHCTRQTADANGG